jgi:hypothetical protein
VGSGEPCNWCEEGSNLTTKERQTMSYSMGTTIYMHHTQTIKLQRSNGGYDLIIDNGEGNTVYLYCFGEDVILSANLVDDKEETEKLKEAETVSEPA